MLNLLASKSSQVSEGKSGRGRPQSKTLARALTPEIREASWSAPVLWRFSSCLFKIFKPLLVANKTVNAPNQSFVWLKPRWQRRGFYLIFLIEGFGKIERHSGS